MRDASKRDGEEQEEQIRGSSKRDAKRLKADSRYFVPQFWNDGVVGLLT